MAETRSIPMDRLWGAEETVDRGVSEPALVIDVAGFEGPLDLLLHLARSQKVDLSRISVLALAMQYLDFIESARRVRLELAADYLVMAAWLAYLKSRLLIPQQKSNDEPSGEEMAATLAFRLQRLEAMREAAARLTARNRLGVDMFVRGSPEHIPEKAGQAFDASLYDLLSAYALLRQRQAVTQVTIARREVWALSDAREILLRLLGEDIGWISLDRYLTRYLAADEDRVTAIASSFAASLELVREGKLQIRQDDAFGAIYLRAGSGRSESELNETGTDGDQ